MSLAGLGTDASALRPSPGGVAGRRERAGFDLWSVFAIDLRTLALFRVALGTYLIADLALRAVDLRAHYTDAGVMPRWEQLDFLSAGSISLHLANGTTAFQALLFAIAGLAAGMLILGWRTRAATVVSWVLLISLQNRNTFILSGEDNLAAVMTFWAMFLPLGARWSVDAALNRHDGAHAAGHAFVSIASAAILIQGMSMYLFSALLKSDAAWGWDGTAVYYALNLDYFATPFAHWLRQFETLLRYLTWAVWTFELVGPILIFSPILHKPLRFAVMTGFIAMHIGFALCLEIGLFPMISIVMNLLFLPGWVWDWMGDRLKAERRPLTAERRALAVWYDRDCAFCLKMCRLLATFLILPKLQIAPAQDHPTVGPLLEAQRSWVVGPLHFDRPDQLATKWHALRVLVGASPVFFPIASLMRFAPLVAIGEATYGLIDRQRERLGRWTAMAMPWRQDTVRPRALNSVLATGFLAFVTIQNLSTLPRSDIALPQSFVVVRQALGLYQNWTMFAPYPEMASPWPVIEGRTVGGRAVDVYKGQDGPPAEQRPRYVSQVYANSRWRKFLSNVEDASYEARPQRLALNYARHLCGTWNENRAGDERLSTFSIVFHVEETPRFDSAVRAERQASRREVWSHDCLG